MWWLLQCIASELGLCSDPDLVSSVSEVCNGENLRYWSDRGKSLSHCRSSTTSRKQFIIILAIIIRMTGITFSYVLRSEQEKFVTHVFS